jgi:ABC-type phosphate transport system substrate-binding protein
MSPLARIRRRILAGLCLLALALLAPSPARVAAGEADEGVVVLLNARNPTQSIGSADLNKIFLGQTAFWHGVVPVRVVLRPDGGIVAKTFYESVLKTTPQAFRKHWDEVQLSGRAVAPKVVASVEEVAALVAQAPGAISYALASEAWKLNNKAVKIVQVR